MITGAHVIINTKDADALRAWFRDTLGFASVDAGDGWLIFKLPPAELGIHPDGNGEHELYLMCDDVETTVKELASKGVESTEIQDVGWGRLTSIKTPDGAELGLYEPKHPTAI